MSLFENFPYTNLHELNLNWLIEQIKSLEENTVISVNGQTGAVVLYQNPMVSLPAINQTSWSIVRSADGITCGIVFDNSGTGYIVHGSVMNRIYSANNPPPYPVTSVNGQYGNIVLYTDRYIRLPDLADAQMDSWNIYRKVNNVNLGIQFEDNGDAYIMHGSNRYKLYSSNNEPDYPVTSVNGETGNIRLYYDNENDIEFFGISPELPDTYHSWKISRALNDADETILQMEITDTGRLKLHVGNAVYDVYSTSNPQPNWVDNPSANVINITADSTSSSWGLIRDTTEGSVGILFDNDSNLTEPAAYVRYIDSSDVVHTTKLLTLDDIPSSSGVVSVNSLTGIVVLTGSNLTVSTTDSRTIPAAFEDVEEVSGYVETGSTASRNIAAGSYVIWNHVLCTATQAISTGDTFSSTNLQAVTEGGFNSLNNTIPTTVRNQLSSFNITATSLTSVESQLDNLLNGMNNGQVRIGRLYGNYSGSMTSGSRSVAIIYRESNDTARHCFVLGTWKWGHYYSNEWHWL